MAEPWVREALIRLNPEIAAQPDRADEVIYNLRACLLSVQVDGLVRVNENFMGWLRGEKTMPFGRNCEHVSVRLVDAVQPSRNQLTVTHQWTYGVDSAFSRLSQETRRQDAGATVRFDVVFLINGLPLVIGEAKTPTRSAVTWFEGAYQINQLYEKEAAAMFGPNVFSFATEGRCYRYGSIRMPIDTTATRSYSTGLTRTSGSITETDGEDVPEIGGTPLYSPFHSPFQIGPVKRLPWSR
ncbi:MAG: hypothetical protein HY318_17775 [Armatimonadetes bacterium]|nr:hypothetical protein [Armatimonadota bacterium]